MHSKILLLVALFAFIFSSSMRAGSIESLTENKNSILAGGGVLTSNEKIDNQYIRQVNEKLEEMEAQIQHLKSDIYKAESEYYKYYYGEYLKKKAEVNLSQFIWQRGASSYMLWLVVIVVLSGIGFSGFQLWKASQINDFGQDSSIEISVQRVKITSSVVGVIVLAISIIFLYLFLIEVYRVNIVDMESTEKKPPEITKEHIESLLLNSKYK